MTEETLQLLEMIKGLAKAVEDHNDSIACLNQKIKLVDQKINSQVKAWEQSVKDNPPKRVF